MHATLICHSNDPETTHKSLCLTFLGAQNFRELRPNAINKPGSIRLVAVDTKSLRVRAPMKEDYHSVKEVVSIW